MSGDLDWANGDFIEGAAEFPRRWAARAAAFRAAAVGRELSYGAGARRRLDLFVPAGRARGLVVFVHGGYWRMFDKASWSHLAAGPVARGWAVAVLSYPLAPQLRLREITAEVARAVAVAAAAVAGPVVLAGHSAGGHLVARMNCADVGLPAAVAGGPDGRLRRIVAISPVVDLRGLVGTALGRELRLDADEAAAESPLLHRARRGVETIAWVGAEERPLFLDQARALAEGWDEARLRVAPGRHHFDVIDELEAADSPLVRTLLG